MGNVWVNCLMEYGFNLNKTLWKWVSNKHIYSTQRALLTLPSILKYAEIIGPEKVMGFQENIEIISRNILECTKMKY